MAPARPDDSKSVQVTKLSNQITRHFKKCGLRKVEFKKQKSQLIEKELQAHFIRAKHARDEDDFPNVPSRPASPESPKKSSSTPALRSSTSEAMSAALPQSLGRAVTRFAAAHTEMMHPAIHPGALSERPASQTRLRRFQAPERSTSPSDEQIAAVTQSAPAWVVHEHPMHPESPGDHVAATSSSGLSKLRRASPKKRTIVSPAFGFFPGATEREETEEDRLFSTPSREDELLAAADADAAALRATWAGGLRPRDPPDMIERLGDLMALLGPRYRTLPRSELWEKAVVGQTTALQRREKRLGAAAAHSISGFAKSRGEREASKNRPRSPEWLPDYDPDGAARAAWLQARERENEMKAKASSRLKVSSVSNLGASVTLCTNQLKLR